jgi:anti-sigma B factor antagonist
LFANLRVETMPSTDDRSCVFPAPIDVNAYSPMKIESTNHSLQIGELTELTAGNAAQFRSQIGAIIQGAHDEVSLDLSSTDLIDSTGVGVLLSLNKLMVKRNGHLRIVHPSRAVSRTLELTRLNRIFEVVK